MEEENEHSTKDNKDNLQDKKMEIIIFIDADD